ncbi:MAG TPA: transglutaminase-like domain-containing protein [Candidatus Micrarchaeia archaeon]|nr:transglutaminase-like domain-containing protein [Candidatus Micrarchaeia archaeon]
MPPADPAVLELAALTGAVGLAALAASWSRRGTAGDGPAAVVSLLLAAGLGVAAAAVLGTTILRTAGPSPELAAATGVLAAGAVGAGGRRRWAALMCLPVAGLAALLLLRGLPAGSGSGPLAGLGPILAGHHPGRAQAFGLELLLLLLGGWIGWWALREGRALVAAGAAALIAVADLVNVPGGHVGPAFWPVIGAVAIASALVGWVHQERVRTGWRARRVAVLDGTPGRPWGAVVAGAIALTAASAALPPLNLVNFSGRFFHYGTPRGGRTAPGAGADVVGYSESVIPAGPLRSVQTPLLTYTAGDPRRPVYLRGVVLDDFARGDWYPATGAVRRSGPSPRARPLDARLRRAGTPLRARRTIRLTVHVLASGDAEVSDVLFPGAPADLPRSETPLVVRGRRAGGRLASVISVQPQGGLAQVAGGGATTTLGTVSTASDRQLRLAGTAYPAWVRSDAGLPPAAHAEAAALRRIARTMIGQARDPYDRALAIQDALRADEAYTLNPPPVPAGTWPILYFLETSHLGYCQYFASSMGALLRSIGIPARLVNGFGPGEAGVAAGAVHLVTAADAHTWVQAYFPRYGWIQFEPTPDGFYLGRGEAPAAVTGLPTHPRRVAPATRPAPTVRSVRPSRPPGRPAAIAVGPVALRVAAALLALGLLGGGGVLGLLRRMVATPLGARRRLGLVLWVGRGGWGRGRTMSELAAFCLAAAGPAAPERVARALRAVTVLADRAAFATGPEAAVTPAEWRRAWAPLRSAYPGLLWRAWRGRAGGAGGAPASAPVPRIG